MVAAELDLPYACIPSGTRNHFALDLGVDRDDVVGALDAFVRGGERRVDLAEVNGRVFVNNVSLGLYADAVQRPGYRAAKLHTLLDTVPDALGPDAKPPDLLGTRRRMANRAPGLQQRVSIAARAGIWHAPATRSGEARGHGAVVTPSFEIDVRVRRSPPGSTARRCSSIRRLRFSTRPGALRVRIAPHHPGASPRRSSPKAWQTFESLAAFVVHGAPADPAPAK